MGLLGMVRGSMWAGVADCRPPEVREALLKILDDPDEDFVELWCCQWQPKTAHLWQLKTAHFFVGGRVLSRRPE